MLKTNEQITFSWNETVKVLEEINLIVVSLDKLGSYYMDKDNSEFEREIARFIVEWKVLKRLAKVRCILSEKFDDTLGEDDMDDLERAMEGLKYWTKPGDKAKDYIE